MFISICVCLVGQFRVSDICPQMQCLAWRTFCKSQAYIHIAFEGTRRTPDTQVYHKNHNRTLDQPLLSFTILWLVSKLISFMLGFFSALWKEGMLKLMGKNGDVGKK